MKSISLAVAAALFAFVPARAEPSPNIVIVFIDDMGWGDLSCFGNTEAATPNMDRLAAEGIRFSNFYVQAPICSPSRCALTTGQYPQRWGIESYLANRQLNQDRGIVQWLDPAVPTLPRILQSAGYATGHFGKWHLGGQRDVDDAPMITEYGFEETLTNFEGLGPRLLGVCNAFDGKPPRLHHLGAHQLGRGPVIWHDRSRLTEGFAGSAIAFINRAADQGRPFYVNVWPDDVHSPFYPPEHKRGDGSKRALYLGVLETMDEQLGPLFNLIRERAELRDNTLILLCSDNGHEPGAGSGGPLRGSKATLYEGGIRSPLVVWGPRFTSPKRTGSVNETSVFSAIDLVPSLLHFARIRAPDAVAFDGENVIDAVLGNTEASRNAPLFWRRPPDRRFVDGKSTTALPDLAVREGSWKLLCNFDGSGVELFNLTNDIGEANNLADRNPDLTQRLTRAAIEWSQSLPTANFNWTAAGPPAKPRPPARQKTVGP